MLRRPHGRARVDEENPQAFGICDRCGVLYNLRDLQFQYAINGLNTINTQLRVCEICTDDLQYQFRNIPLPADPLPKRNARPEPYMLDEVDYLATQDLEIITTQDDIKIVVDDASQNFSDVPNDPNNGVDPPNTSSSD
ncbi:MAG TPA: hypothetical protein VHE81_06555 [Lacipirellulaceae bacterium]|jgi:hypothetical protein|nr:hypothetical protein [Lacipirellulaceae bacterium]